MRSRNVGAVGKGESCSRAAACHGGRAQPQSGMYNTVTAPGKASVSARVRSPTHSNTKRRLMAYNRAQLDHILLFCIWTAWVVLLEFG